MNVPQEELNAWARAGHQIHAACGQVTAALRRGRPDEAAAALDDAKTRAWRLMQGVVRLGADRPEELRPRAEIPLHLMDTPANRRLLTALRVATEAAAEVDRERGTYPDGLNEVLAHLTANVALEVEGPVGQGRE